MPAKNETNESLQAFAADAEALLAYIEASIDLEPKQGGVDCAKLRRGSRKAFHDGKPGRTTVGARRFRELIDAVLESGKTASHAGVSDVDFNTLQGFAHALRCANPTLP